MPHLTRIPILLILLGMLAGHLSSAYLKDMPMTLSQPDGSKIECLASGDEYHNWLHDKDYYTIIRDQDTGWLTYAEQDGDVVKAGSLIVGRDDPFSHRITPGINIKESRYKQLRQSRFQAPITRNAPTTGTINNIVIFIRFSGENEFGQNISVYDGWFNSSTSSQKNYYLEASYNQLTVDTSFFPAPQNNYVVSWQDSNPRAYYQPYNASTNPQGYSTDNQRQSREFTLLQNAVNGVSSQIPSSLVIDSDGDNRVDNVVFIVSGSAGEWSSLLWPHRWSLFDRYVYINGKRVYDFNFQLQNFLATRAVGVICHEFFHTLGAPDLYHYTDNGISPAGAWDLMESDQNPPQHMTAYMKWKYGGWIPSIPTIYMGQQYSINSLVSPTNNCYRINSSHPNQYYVVEYRKKTGTFENSVPGSGMLVYRIDTSAGDGNASGPPDELYIYRPNGTNTVNGIISQAFFSQQSGRININSSTNPNPFLADGSAGNLNISGIGSSAGTSISFTLNVPTIDFEPNPHSEGFDAVSFPPNGWMNLTISGSYGFERVTSGTSPTASPQAGAAMVRYRSYNASSGSNAILATPRLDCTEAASFAYSYSFYMYRDSGSSTRADKIEVYLSTTPDLSGTNTLLQTIHRSRNLAPSVSSNGWYQYGQTLPITEAGYYYIVFKAISAYGNNMYLDSVSLQKLLLPPSSAINPVPEDNAMDVNPFLNLRFSLGTGYPSGYVLYLGTDNPPTNIINGLDLGNQLSYNLFAELAYLTTHYWKIVPYNDGGMAQDVPVWSFTTAMGFGIESLPHLETFDGVEAPHLPDGWNVIVISTSTSAAVRNQTSPYANSFTPPNCVSLTNSTDQTADLRLISPKINVPLAGIRVSFKARGLGNGYTLQVGSMNGFSEQFELGTSLTLTNALSSYTVTLPDFMGSGAYLVFKNGLGGSNRLIYLDDVLIEAIFPNDLKLSSFTHPGIGIIGQPLQCDLEVSNQGQNPVYSYTLELISVPDGAILSSQQITQTLAAGDVANHNLGWTSLQSQAYQVMARILFESDQNPTNDHSPVRWVSIGSGIASIGDATANLRTNLLPLNLNKNSSLSETIYLAAELGAEESQIMALSWEYAAVQNLSGLPVKIWMKNTTRQNLSSGWLDFEGYELVFDGIVDFVAGQSSLTLILDQAFEYTGANLALRTSRPLDSLYYNSGNQFYYNNLTATPLRSRYANGSTNLDPITPATAGTGSSYVPVTSFSILIPGPESLSAPQVSISQGAEYLRLSWAPIENALSYQIFATNDPQSWPEVPVAGTSETRWSIPASQARMFYRVRAVR